MIKNNPFKMLGPWLGAVALIVAKSGLLPLNPSYRTNIEEFFTNIFTINPFSWWYSWVIMPAIVGFLIGWGIHILIRRFKR